MKVGDLVQWVGPSGFGTSGELGLVTEVHEQEWHEVENDEPYKMPCPKWLIILWANGDIEQLSEDDVEKINTFSLTNQPQQDTLPIEPE